MSRWTKDSKEVSQISEIATKLIKAAIVRVSLDTGAVLEGVVRNVNTGNNASTVRTDGRWLYYGEFDLETLEGERYNVDMLLVRSVADVWVERASVYEKAGLISITK